MSGGLWPWCVCVCVWCVGCLHDVCGWVFRGVRVVYVCAMCLYTCVCAVCSCLQHVCVCVCVCVCVLVRVLQRNRTNRMCVYGERERERERERSILRNWLTQLGGLAGQAGRLETRGRVAVQVQRPSADRIPSCQGRSVFNLFRPSTDCSAGQPALLRVADLNVTLIQKLPSLKQSEEGLTKYLGTMAQPR